ncbi:MAG TPA: TolC family protein [Desulfuromonadales bacterium]|nr:TolC family protein [Desulfuromonadales bacterium]
MKCIVILLVVLMPALCAAESRILTLEQALAIALDKNRDIEKAREYGQYVQGKYVEERAAALPQLSLNGSAQFSKDESLSLMGITAQRQFGRSLDLTVSQPLYTWGKLNAAIRAAEVGLKTADQQLRLYRQAVYRDVTTAYYDILLAKDLHRLAQENRAQKLRHLEEATRKLSAGVATDYDVLAAEVSADNSRPEVIRTENNIRMARERLRFLLVAGAVDLDVAGSLQTPTTTTPLPASFDEAFTTAGKQRPELSELRLRIGIYEELVTIAAADDKPRLEMRGAAGWRWASLNDPGPTRDGDGAVWNVGVYLTFPFFDGLRTRGRITQAESDLRTQRIAAARLLDSIALEVRQAEFSFREASEICAALSGTVKQADRLVQMAEKGYEFGVKISLEVEDAQVNLLQARSNLAKAQRDYHVARVTYLWSLGGAGE